MDILVAQADRIIIFDRHVACRLTARSSGSKVAESLERRGRKLREERE